MFRNGGSLLIIGLFRSMGLSRSPTLTFTQNAPRGSWSCHRASWAHAVFRSEKFLCTSSGHGFLTSKGRRICKGKTRFSHLLSVITQALRPICAEKESQKTRWSHQSISSQNGHIDRSPQWQTMAGVNTKYKKGGDISESAGLPACVACICFMFRCNLSLGADFYEPPLPPSSPLPAPPPPPPLLLHIILWKQK